MGGSAGTSRPGPWHTGTTPERPRHRIAGVRGTGFVVAAFLAAGVGVLAAGCGSDDPDDPPESVSIDAVLTALVDWAVGSNGTPTTTEDEPPVVYITASNGDTIDAAVQASVVAATTDDATVRFADDRSEAIDDTTEDEHVHDDGVLLVVGELPAEAQPTRVPMSDVIVERYRTIDDASVFVVTVAPDGDGASVIGAVAE